MTNSIIIALDFPDLSEADKFLEQFDEPLYVKVGMELYMQTGPSIVKHLKSLGHQVFLDLKLHDIPNTVKSAMKVLAQSGVDMVNVHASGGLKMMQAAKEGLEEGALNNHKPLLIAVTQLTSTSQTQMNEEQKILGPIQDSVQNYAILTQNAGLDGVVCSPLEASIIKEATSNQFLTITPGIRLTSKLNDDQTRIMTPRDAAKNGSDYIVVGRPITQATDPVEAYRYILKEWQAELK